MTLKVSKGANCVQNAVCSTDRKKAKHSIGFLYVKPSDILLCSKFFALRLYILYRDLFSWSGDNIAFGVAMLILACGGKIETRYVNIEAGNHIYFMTKYW
jgi:hypothetical protein